MAQHDHARRPGNLGPVAPAETTPSVVEVLRFEDLPLGSRGSRRAVVRWSDGTEGEALSWYADLCGHPHKSAYVDSGVMPIGASTAKAPRAIGRVCSG
jgi:hypothetical protein